MATLASFLLKSAVADEGSVFYSAIEALHRGDVEKAEALFLELATERPEDPFADDALSELARLYEEKRSAPQKALEIYQMLLRRYPDSRLARRAESRVALLTEGMGQEGQHAEALATFQDLLRSYASRPIDETIAELETLLTKHPEFPLADHALFLLATQQEKVGNAEAALDHLRLLQENHPQGVTAQRALRAEGDILVRQRRFNEAEKRYAELEQDDVIGFEEALGSLASARKRYRAWQGAWIFLAAYFTISLILLRRARATWRATALALRRPPWEVWYVFPILILFVAAGMTENILVERAIQFLALGSCLVLWCHGVVMKAMNRPDHSRSFRRFAALASFAATAVLAIGYIAVAYNGLLDQLIETWHHGPGA